MCGRLWSFPFRIPPADGLGEPRCSNASPRIIDPMRCLLLYRVIMIISTATTISTPRTLRPYSDEALTCVQSETTRPVVDNSVRLRVGLNILHVMDRSLLLS